MLTTFLDLSLARSKGVYLYISNNLVNVHRVRSDIEEGNICFLSDLKMSQENLAVLFVNFQLFYTTEVHTVVKASSVNSHSQVSLLIQVILKISHPFTLASWVLGLKILATMPRKFA